MRSKKCPMCHKAAAPAKDNASFPFCSRRCKLLDLGNWLDERYLVPERSPFDEDDGRVDQEELDGT